MYFNFHRVPLEIRGRVMTPREQLRKMTALGEQGALDEKHWYRLVNGMSAGGETNNNTEEVQYCQEHSNYSI